MRARPLHGASVDPLLLGNGSKGDGLWPAVYLVLALEPLCLPCAWAGGLVRCVLSVEEQAERARQDSDFAVHPPPPKPQSCSGAGREPAGFDRINPWLIAGVRVLRRPGVCQAPSVPLADVQPLAEQFAASWREAIRETNLAVMGNFHNMKNGMEILKRTLTQVRAPKHAAGEHSPAQPWRGALTVGRHRPPPPPPRTNWTRRVPHPVLIGHAPAAARSCCCTTPASLTSSRSTPPPPSPY